MQFDLEKRADVPEAEVLRFIKQGRFSAGQSLALREIVDKCYQAGESAARYYARPDLYTSCVCTDDVEGAQELTKLFIETTKINHHQKTGIYRAAVFAFRRGVASETLILEKTGIGERVADTNIAEDLKHIYDALRTAADQQKDSAPSKA